MKKGIHPDYQFVIFKDSATNFAFLGRSTKGSAEKEKWEDGNEYPLIRLEISSSSHPFFTGKEKLVDSEGRIVKFNKKFKRS